MNPLQGSALQLEVDEVLESGPTVPKLFAAHTRSGEHYLVAHASGEDRTGTWMCAPISEFALAFVRNGRAEVRDAFAHSATGAVDIVTIAPDGHCTESVKMCNELRDADLPSVVCHPRSCA
jgi:hypothetical protein